MKISLRILPLVCFALLASGCHTPIWSPTGPGGEGRAPQVVYIPFVENVSAPSSVTSGQPFTITITLSTAAMPELLTEENVVLQSQDFSLSPAQPTVGISHAGGIVQPFLYRITWYTPTPLQPVGNQLTFTGRLYEPGQYYFYIASAKNAASGGQKITVWSNSEGYHFEDTDRSQFDYREISIDVI